MKNLMFPALLFIFLVTIFTCSTAGKDLKKDSSGESVFDSNIINENKSTGKDFLQIGYDLLAIESIGILRIGLKDSDIIRELGDPEKKSAQVLMGYDGKKHQSWYYDKKGIEIGLVDEEDSRLTDYIRIENPCKYKTRRNIGIGSGKTDAIEAYRYEIDSGLLTDDADTITAGTVYGGIIFSLDKDGRVESIFMGSAAE